MQRSRLWLALAAGLWLGLCPAPAADPGVNPPVPAPARVIEVTGPGALVEFEPDPGVVRRMVARGLTTLTRQPTETAAWLSLVTTSDVVGLKVYSQPGLLSGTRPVVVAAVVQGLLAAGLPPQHIIIWDKHAGDLRTAGFFQLGRQFGVRVAGCDQDGYDEQSFYAPDTAVIGNLVWGDLEFGRKDPGVGRKSFVAKLVSREITKIISVAPVLNLEASGVSGHLYSVTLGSVDNTVRFEGSAERLAVAVPELYALPVLGDRVALNITDALLGQYEGGRRSLLHYSTVLDQLWFSRDPVALDTLAIQELQQERKAHGANDYPPHLDLYHNAVLLQLGVTDPAQMTIERVKL
jgi:hypothetical protein